MQKAGDKAGGLLGGLSSLLWILGAPGIGIILLVVGIVLIAVLLGFLVVIYLTLQAYHLMTAVIFLVCTLFMLYAAVRSKVITDSTMHKYPWIPLLIPGAFLFGYVAELTTNIKLTVAPLATATVEQGTANGVVLFILAFGCLYALVQLTSKDK
jgi:hypothetical protein